MRTIGGIAVGECPLTGGVICRDLCCFRTFDSLALVLSYDCATSCCGYGVLSSVFIPDSARELCDQCFAFGAVRI